MLDSTTSIYMPRSTKKLTTEEFIQKSINIHGNRYDYSKVVYENNRSKVIIICPIHGEFKQGVKDHLGTHGCSKCGKDILSKIYSSDIETFIFKSHVIHKYKYDYSKSVYNGSNSKMTIICPIHGEFKQIPYSHLQGHGCRYCMADKQRTQNGIKWTEKYKNKPCLLYLIRCFDDSEVFLKIGVTSQSIKKRYSRVNAMPYNYDILYERIGTSYEVYDIEGEIKHLFDYHKPQMMFKGGYTETLKIHHEREILEFIKQ
jgi:hypothetical protein